MARNAYERGGSVVLWKVVLYQALSWYPWVDAVSSAPHSSKRCSRKPSSIPTSSSTLFQPHEGDGAPVRVRVGDAGHRPSLRALILIHQQ